CHRGAAAHRGRRLSVSRRHPPLRPRTRAPVTPTTMNDRPRDDDEPSASDWLAAQFAADEAEAAPTATPVPERPPTPEQPAAPAQPSVPAQPSQPRVSQPPVAPPTAA